MPPRWQEILAETKKFKEFFEGLNPVTLVLLAMLVVTAPITLISFTSDKELLSDVQNYFHQTKLKELAWDILIVAPLKEEFKYRLPIFLLSYLKPMITLNSPLAILWLICIIFPGMDWSLSHVSITASLLDSILLGWLVFRIGGIKGFAAAILVHFIVNLSAFIGMAFSVNLVIK